MKVFIVGDMFTRHIVAAKDDNQALDLVVTQTKTDRKYYYVYEIDTSKARVIESEDSNPYLCR